MKITYAPVSNDPPMPVSKMRNRFIMQTPQHMVICDARDEDSISMYGMRTRRIIIPAEWSEAQAKEKATELLKEHSSSNCFRTFCGPTKPDGATANA